MNEAMEDFQISDVESSRLSLMDFEAVVYKYLADDHIPVKSIRIRKLSGAEVYIRKK